MTKAQEAALENTPTEYRLLLELSGEFSAFRTGRGSTKTRTLVLTPYGSHLFGLTVANEAAYLGCPERYFDAFCNARWHQATIVKGVADYLFLPMTLGERGVTVALAVRVRPARLSLLNRFDEICVVPIDYKGRIGPEDDRSFTLSLTQEDQRSWELG